MKPFSQISDWIEEIPGVKRVIISNDYSINGRDCKKGGHKICKYHRIVETECFQEYNSIINKGPVAQLVRAVHS